MYGVLVLCMGYESCVLGKSHATRVQLLIWRSILSYVWDICLMSGMFVLCVGYYSYVWDISLMYWRLVFCMGY
jgi:hypothetical protein